MRYNQSRPPKSRTQLTLNSPAACDHLLSIYSTDEDLLQVLENFVGEGLKKRDGCIVIATEDHRQELERRLTAQRIDLNAARQEDLYVSLDAAETLSTFIRDGWPDEELFASAVGTVLSRARKNGRHVRAFGEMVALLWAQDNYRATIRLEYLWQELCQAEGFSLLCSYPQSAATGNLRFAFEHIHATHSGNLSVSESIASIGNP